MFLYSVFSHLDLDDVRFYLSEIERVLAPAGTAFLTGFFEEDVPTVAENPDDYLQAWEGPLHAVRYDRARFEQLVKDAGLGVRAFEYGQETDGQSAYYLVLSSS